MKKYEILLPVDEIIFKDDGKRLVCIVVDKENEKYPRTLQTYQRFIHAKLLDILLTFDYNYKNEKQIIDGLQKGITEAFDTGASLDLGDTVLQNLYVADLKTGNTIFNHHIEDLSSIIRWSQSTSIKTLINSQKIKWHKVLTYIIGLVAVVLAGLLIHWMLTWLGGAEPLTDSGDSENLIAEPTKHKINTIYDPNICSIYFADTTFSTIDYYIDYQKKIKTIDEIDWRLQSNSISVMDTLFLKDDCTVYVRGKKDTNVSEVHAINVSYLDFITELLVTRDPRIKSMLVTNSSTPFGNTTFLVDGIPQQASYYKSSELIEYIKNGFKVTSVKKIDSNQNPTNKLYPKLSQIIIQKQ